MRASRRRRYLALALLLLAIANLEWGPGPDVLRMRMVIPPVVWVSCERLLAIWRPERR